MMSRRLPASAVLCLLLSACAAGDVSSAVNGVVDTVTVTASGALREAKLVKERAEATLDDAKRRADNIQQGVQKITEGKELIEKGFGDKE
jgi:ABC-type glycerol-3-phosphate transport system substrate-binding protein